MLVLESLLHRVSMKCPGDIQGEPPCGLPFASCFQPPGGRMTLFVPFSQRENCSQGGEGVCPGMWAHRGTAQQ